MQTTCLHKEFYHIRNLDVRGASEQAQNRLNKLELYKQLRKEGCCERTSLIAIKTPRSTYYRWKYNYDHYGIAGLENESKRLYNMRENTWSKKLISLVLRIRKENPTYGKDVIAAILKRDYAQFASTSTIGRIISFLVMKGKVRPVSFYYGHVKEKRRRVFNKHAQRWRYGMKPANPGELIQFDHATRELSDGTVVKSFKAVDQVTKYSVEQAYGSATAINAKDFLQYATVHFPFPIKSIIVDGGSEFMAEFEEGCYQMKIELWVLPPRSPKYNGCVERGNRTTKYDFYGLYTGATDLPTVRAYLKKFITKYNTYRPHQALHYQTPWQYYQNWEAEKSHMY